MLYVSVQASFPFHVRLLWFIERRVDSGRLVLYLWTMTVSPLLLFIFTERMWPIGLSAGPRYMYGCMERMPAQNDLVWYDVVATAPALQGDSSNCFTPTPLALYYQTLKCLSHIVHPEFRPFEDNTSISRDYHSAALFILLIVSTSRWFDCTPTSDRPRMVYQAALPTGPLVRREYKRLPSGVYLLYALVSREDPTRLEHS